METITLHKLGESTIDFDPSVPCLIHNYIDFMMSEEFRSQLDAGLELMIEKKKELGKIAWIANTKKMDVMPIEDLDWIIKDWYIRFLAAGIKYTAMVIPENELALVAMETGTEMSNQSEGTVLKDLISKEFPDLESAKSWLREVLNG